MQSAGFAAFCLTAWRLLTLFQATDERPSLYKCLVGTKPCGRSNICRLLRGWCLARGLFVLVRGVHPAENKKHGTLGLQPHLASYVPALTPADATGGI